MTDETMQWSEMSQNAPGLTGLMVAVLIKFPGINSVQLKQGTLTLTLLLENVTMEQQEAFSTALDRYRRILEQRLDTDFFHPSIDWKPIAGFSQLTLSWSLDQFVPVQVQLVFELLWNELGDNLLAEDFWEEQEEVPVREGFMEEQLKQNDWNTADTLIAYRDRGRVLVYSVPAAG